MDRFGMAVIEELTHGFQKLPTRILKKYFGGNIKNSFLKSLKQIGEKPNKKPDVHNVIINNLNETLGNMENRGVIGQYTGLIIENQVQFSFKEEYVMNCI